MLKNTKKISVVYKSKHNNKREKQVILLMISDGKKYHYLAVTSLFALLKEASSNHKEDFYCLHCFNSYTIKNKLEEHEEICNNHNSCRIEKAELVNKILKHNPGEKSLKAPFTNYLDSECLLKKEQSHNNNNINNNNNNNKIEESYIEKKASHEPCGWSMFIRCSFGKKKKLNYYRGKDCIEKLCKKLKENATEIINREKK